MGSNPLCPPPPPLPSPSPPGSLGCLPNLHSLSATNNNLVTSFPVGLCQAARLAHINLSNATLSGALPSCVCTMPYLQTLDVSNSSMHAALPSCLGAAKDTPMLTLTASCAHLEGEVPQGLTGGTLRRVEVNCNPYLIGSDNCHKSLRRCDDECFDKKMLNDCANLRHYSPGPNCRVARVQGQVVSAASVVQGMADVHVTAYAPDSLLPLASCDTDASGSYSLDLTTASHSHSLFRVEFSGPHVCSHTEMANFSRCGTVTVDASLSPLCRTRPSLTVNVATALPHSVKPEGATVSLSSTDGVYHASAKTNANGTALFDALPEGLAGRTYTMAVSTVPGLPGQTMQDGVTYTFPWCRAATVKQTVPCVQQSVSVGLCEDPYARNPAMVEGITLSFFDETTSPRHLLGTASCASGHSTRALSPASVLPLPSWDMEEVTVEWVYEDTENKAVVQLGYGLTQETLHTQCATAVTGQITNAFDGYPVPDAEVVVGTNPIRSGTTDDLGRYSIVGVPDGAWPVTVTTIPTTADGDAALTPAFPGCGSSTLDIAVPCLEESVCVSVTNMDGTYADGIYVYYYDVSVPGTKAYLGHSVTDGSAAPSLTSCLDIVPTVTDTPVSEVLVAFFDNHGQAYVEDLPPLHCGVNTHTVGTCPNVISGMVSDTDGAPIEGVIVSLDAYPATATTDALGEYALWSVPSGVPMPYEYTVTYAKTGNVTGTSTATPSDCTTTAGMHMVLSPTLAEEECDCHLDPIPLLHQCNHTPLCGYTAELYCLKANTDGTQTVQVKLALDNNSDRQCSLRHVTIASPEDYLSLTTNTECTSYGAIDPTSTDAEYLASINRDYGYGLTLEYPCISNYMGDSPAEDIISFVSTGNSINMVLMVETGMGYESMHFVTGECRVNYFGRNRVQFIDKPVSNLTVVMESGGLQTLDENGGAFYTDGDRASFYVGNQLLGTTTLDRRIYPMDVLPLSDMDDVRVANMAMLLQSLDSDGVTHNIIEITHDVIKHLNSALDTHGVITDWRDTEHVEAVINTTIASASVDGITLTKVSQSDAKNNLESSISKDAPDMFKKNISKTFEQLSTKATMEIMDVWVPARQANGLPTDLLDDYIHSDYVVVNDPDAPVQEVDRDYTYRGVPYFDDEGNVFRASRMAKPIVAVYTDEHEDVHTDYNSSDIWVAVSRDDGNTWKRKNLSKSADRSSFTRKNGDEYFGTCEKPQNVVLDNYIMVSWVSKYALGGKPHYTLLDDESKDIWGVSGPQRSVDYTYQDYPEVGEVPYGVIWTCRGVIATEDSVEEITDENGTVIETLYTFAGDILWYKPERLTSGRRDAMEAALSGAEEGGFGIVWQEDPEGLRPGDGRGPGEGWSGANTNKKTDIWYSYISWENFAETIPYDEDDEQHDGQPDDPTGDGTSDGEGDGTQTSSGYSPRAAHPMSLPVRLSNNDIVNVKNMQVMLDDKFGLPEIGPECLTWEFVQDLNDPTDEGIFECSVWDTSGAMSFIHDPNIDKGSHDAVDGEAEADTGCGSHAYGYKVEGLCDTKTTSKVSYDDPILENHPTWGHIVTNVTPYVGLCAETYGEAETNADALANWPEKCLRAPHDTHGGGSNVDEDVRNTYYFHTTEDCGVVYNHGGRWLYKRNHQGEEKLICVTEDGIALDGNTAAARPNLHLEPFFDTTQGKMSAYAMVAFDETKGVGGGEPLGSDESDPDADSPYGDTGDPAYKPDLGKNVIYQTFRMDDPDVVSDGFIINMPEMTTVVLDEWNKPRLFEVTETVDGETVTTFVTQPLPIDDEVVYYVIAGETTDIVQSVSTPKVDPDFDFLDPECDPETDGYCVNNGLVQGVSILKTAPVLTAEGTAALQPALVYLREQLVEMTTGTEVFDDMTDVCVPTTDADENMTIVTDYKLDCWGRKMLATENARRPRFVAQDPADIGDKGLAMVILWKQGPEGDGGPSDQFMRRFVATKRFEDELDGPVGQIDPSENPYAFENCVCAFRVTPEGWDSEVCITPVVETEEQQSALEPHQLSLMNTSGHTAVVTAAAAQKADDPSEVSKDDEKEGAGEVQVYLWHQTKANLYNSSTVNNLDVARASRGSLIGDRLIIAFTYAPNHAAQTHGNDVYDFKIRRSFDGGETFTTDPNGTVNTVHYDYYKSWEGEIADADTVLSEAYETVPEIPNLVKSVYAPGDWEPARNLSNMLNTKYSVIEPRVAVLPAQIEVSEDRWNELLGSAREAETVDDVEFGAVKYLLASVPGEVEQESGGHGSTNIVYTVDNTQLDFDLTDYNPLEDVPNTSAFYVAYGTDNNPKKDKETGEIATPVPLDIFYSYSQNYGNQFYGRADITDATTDTEDGDKLFEERLYYTDDEAGWVVDTESDADPVEYKVDKPQWYWLARGEGMSGEAQIRMTPDGSRCYAIWVTDAFEDGVSEPFSDVLFRRIQPHSMSGV
ncbi:hypothetical protein KIPB_001314 [Kipferlia bialata]|uniref:Uncharacterized protein n=1 Tax=Kipferlia bialata TaxID=797122 RepID=A0A9K3CNN4_9EUKA|nr:hypothetical protein KIPB_001314 [Kipferlia bialata]|eukprot:g1314.t1